MKLEIREIASTMVGPRESVIDLQAPSQGGVTSLAQLIPFRDALEEMHLSDNSEASPVRGTGAVVNAASTVVTLTTAQEPLPVESTSLRRAR